MPEPTKIPRAFADSGDKNSIPDSSGSIGFASWQEGFPAITSEPFAQGGVAPKRADFNGIFNALSAGLLWLQQGGVYAYDNVTNYEVGNLAAKSGIIYICKTANGPASTVKDPAADTAETYWARIYPQNGTFNRMFFSQTSGSYTAPATGTYRVTLKGGGGGGAGIWEATKSCGGGGGEGGTLIFYVTLTKNQSYPYVIGAGGSAGNNPATTTTDIGTAGGTSSFDAVYTVSGGSPGSTRNGGFLGGNGGLTYQTPSGAVALFIPGASGQCGNRVDVGDYLFYRSAGGGGNNYFNNSVRGGGGGGGGAGGPFSGAAGYILIEYAG